MNNPSQKRAQGVGPEFKTQGTQKKKKKRERTKLDLSQYQM
jgi:hypothetical protein